jgi:hypothetical protein
VRFPFPSRDSSTARIGDPLAGPPSLPSGSPSISGRAPSSAAALSFSRLLVKSAKITPSRRQLVFMHCLHVTGQTVTEGVRKHVPEIEE